MVNYAQHQIERWGNPLESECTAFANAADVIQTVQDTQASICKELGDAHVACAYCLSMLGGSNDSVSRHTYWLCCLVPITEFTMQRDCRPRAPQARPRGTGRDTL